MRALIKRTSMYTSLLIIILAASGCSLAPKEEVLPDAPVIPTTAVQEYKKVEVIRGDITDRVTVDCTYKAFHTEDLKFGVDGARISHVYVEEGDHVKAGDVLADLDMSDVNQQLEDHSNNIDLIKLKISQEEMLEQLSITTRNNLKNKAGYTDQIDNSYEMDIASHENTLKELKDNLYIEQKRVEELKDEVKKHQIIAGTDGIVSFVATYKDGDLSDKDTSFITVYDPNTMVFITNGKNEELFKDGLEVNVSVSDVQYKAVVISPDASMKKQANTLISGIVYLKADDKENQLQNGDKGEITFVLNEIKNVLYLPTGAVHEANGKSIVYMEDEGGFKSVKEITTGLEADGKVEIVSGLNEGDSVILD